MAGATKLLTAGGGGVILTPASSIASDVTVQIPSADATLLTNKTAGTVLQVVSTTKTDTFTSSSATYTAVTGLSVSITPTSATSKILVIVSVNGSQTVGTNDAYFGIFRNSTQIAMGDAAGSRVQISGMLNSGNSGWQVNSGMNFLDSPSTTTSTTYAVQVRTGNGSNLYINRGLTDSDAASGAGRAASTITAMEIAQ